ncbi:MAG: hypothetical protein ABIM89_04515, partial [Mycobacteriales bacterium]
FAFKSNNLAAFMSVSSDPGDYGAIRVLTAPAAGSIPGPVTTAQAFVSDQRFSRDESLLSGGSSELIYGNLLTLPVGKQLVYVQPIYVRGKEASAYPTLQRVLVGYGNKVGYGSTFAEALRDAVTQSVSGAPAAPPPATPVTPSAAPSGTATASPTAPAASPGVVPATVAEAVAEALAADKAAQAALQQSPPDFAAYDVAQRRLRSALERIAQLAGSAVPNVSPPPTPASSPAG